MYILEIGYNPWKISFQLSGRYQNLIIHNILTKINVLSFVRIAFDIIAFILVVTAIVDVFVAIEGTWLCQGTIENPIRQ